METSPAQRLVAFENYDSQFIDKNAGSNGIGGNGITPAETEPK